MFKVRTRLIVLAAALTALLVLPAAAHAAASPSPSPSAPLIYRIGLQSDVDNMNPFSTYNTIPWAPLDLKRATITPDRTFAITVAEHRFTLPTPQLRAACGEKVLFNVTSKDLTYGFGLFRQDNSMLFQMQVVPGHVNDILWVFDRPGIYTIRSTEYSGPAGIGMIERNAVEITCADGSAN